MIVNVIKLRFVNVKLMKYVLIDEDGLPCCDNDNPDAEPVKLIGSEDILLERLNTSASPEPEEGE